MDQILINSYFKKNSSTTELTNTAGLQSQSGAQIIKVNKGDVFGFGIDATDTCCGAGNVSINDFFSTFWPIA
jgi:hypothetical protein